MNRLGKKPLIFLTILLYLFSFSTSRDTLTTTQSLSDGETLISADGTFALGFFTPSYSSNNDRYIGIWYHNIPVHTVIWVANCRHPSDGTAGNLFITTNGTLGITDGNSSIIWPSTLTLEVTNPIARLLDTGNFVVTSGDDLNSFSWQSFDYPTDTFVPGMKLGWSRTSGLNRNLTAWSSPTDPSPGNFTFAMDLHGDPQMILWEGSKRIIRSGPWTGLAFSGLLPFNPSYTTTFAFNFVNNKEEIYYTMNVIDSSTLARLVMNQSGILQVFVLLDSGQWGLYWHSPSTQCDSYLACGPYGAVCDTDGSPMCSCLQGFLPKKPADWALRDWSSGCIRKTKLDCRNGTDGFVTVKQALLPDTVSATVDMTKSLVECRAECLRNCSCTAFASADTRGGGNGCIIWSTEISDVLVYSNGGQDFYMRLAAADMGSISQHSGHPILAVVLSVILGTILLLVTAIYFIWRRWKQIRGTTSICEESIAENTEQDEMELPLFDLVAIEAATSNFSDRNKLGEGGFGPVYMGKMNEGQEIAVKRLSKTSVQGLDELKTEVMLVAKLQHRNLVRLLGCCIQGVERILVYEYMPNRSLDAFLFDEEKVVLLDWKTRYRIILGISRGLLYLHQDSRFRIIHRDLKASNILLDRDMNPKISDFGLARIFGGDETKTKTRRVVGTYGYMSPEYALNGIFSVKSDVFSFGVLVLEIISSMRNRGVYLSEAEEYLLGKAWTLWKEGNGLQLVDASLDHSFSASEVLRCIKVGLLCVQECPEDRPTMSSVILMLGSDHAFLPEPKQPGFLTTKKYPEGSSSSMKENSDSVNGVTITMSIAR